MGAPGEGFQALAGVHLFEENGLAAFRSLTKTNWPKKMTGTM
jgi:hypothetical protein